MNRGILLRKRESERAAEEPAAEEAAEAEDGANDGVVDGANDAGGLSDEQLELLLTREAEIKERTPDFDLFEFMDSSPLVEALVVMGFDLLDIVGQFSGEGALKAERKRAEEEMLARILERNALPVPVGRSGEGAPRRSVADMSDEEIREIDRAVKAGKRVKL